MRIGIVVVALVSVLAGGPALAEQTFVVAPRSLADEKAVFATVETAKVVPARARIGGTIVQLTVQQGNRVEQDQPIATITDPKLALQIKSLDAQIAGLEAELAKAKVDFDRMQELFGHGTASKASLDAAQTAFERRDQFVEGAQSRALRRQAADRRRNGAGADGRPRADGAGDQRHGHHAG